jgi:hypothetical protein
MSPLSKKVTFACCLAIAAVISATSTTATVLTKPSCNKYLSPTEFLWYAIGPEALQWNSAWGYCHQRGGQLLKAPDADVAKSTKWREVLAHAKTLLDVDGVDNVKTLWWNTQGNLPCNVMDVDSATSTPQLCITKHHFVCEFESRPRECSSDDDDKQESEAADVQECKADDTECRLVDNCLLLVFIYSFDVMHSLMHAY